jgi:ubiquinone/menaquinone biosynthesis C-methylase UbiE
MPSIAFDPAAEYYDNTRGYPGGVADAIREAVLAHIGANLQTSFLELGVGTGRIALPFIEEGYNYTGVDLSLPMMQQLVNKLASKPVASKNYRGLVQADVTRLPFKAASFDVAMAVHVLHLVENWQLALEEAVRVLRTPGGWLVIGYDAPVQGETPSVAQQVNKQWDAILADFGLSREKLLPGLADRSLERQTILQDYLQKIGAQTEVVMLVEYMTPPLSLREMAERHIKRMYSADWLLSAEVHTAAVSRLETWLNTECSEPDQPLSSPTQFKALIAHW